MRSQMTYWLDNVIQIIEIAGGGGVFIGTPTLQPGQFNDNRWNVMKTRVVTWNKLNRAREGYDVLANYFTDRDRFNYARTRI